MELIFISLLFFLVLFIVLFIKKSSELKKIENRFKDILDLDEEKVKIREKVDKLLLEEKELKEKYAEKRKIFDSLIKEIDVLEENLDFISYGVYEPHFDFDSSEKYKEKISELRAQQKDAIRQKTAAICQTEWTVMGSKSEGKKMISRNLKLIIRAFNGECDAAILKVNWNNVSKMKERINRAFIALNKLGEPNHIEITNSYLRLKLNELYAVYEYQEKRYQEKEEQRRIREQMREEERVQKEIEKEKRDAEQDEKRYQKAMEKAKKELSEAHGDNLKILEDKIKELEENIRLAHEIKERAISRAQLTKSGHVYIISNIGSLGENVYKIGMTRRLDPIDRVKELGDASVPFSFDVHAMIYSDNAPELENNLHKVFHNRRLNLVNQRKEFFSVSLNEISNYILDNHGEIEFTKIAEAREYRESKFIREAEENKIEEEKRLASTFPAEI